MTQLTVVEVSVRFGGTAALDRISLQVEPGKVTGLIGPNGAGKTTLFNVVTGLLAPRSGSVEIDGRDITGAAPHRRARLGLARTFQRLELFSSLTVRDNVRVGGDIRNSWGFGVRGRRAVDVDADTERILALCGLTAVADRQVAEVPTGQARVVELARALMTRPSVLLLDEPASGQTEAETVAFGHLLRRLADDGLAVCLVEHDMALVMDVCETISVLDYGRTIAVGPPEQIRDDPAVIGAYLGTEEAAL